MTPKSTKTSGPLTSPSSQIGRSLPVDGPTSQAPALDEQAYEAIKERILTLYFLPGQYVNEKAVASLLGVGRTPTHQALQRLKVEGLVEIIPRKGVIIRADSATDILKLLDSRATVEPELASRAAALVRPDQIAGLIELASDADSPECDGRIDAFVRADRAFHAKVAKISDNSVLAEFAIKLHERCSRFWYLHLWQTLDAKTTAREHLAIARAIGDGNQEEAAAAMKSHIATLKYRVDQIKHIAPFQPYTVSRRR